MNRNSDLPVLLSARHLIDQFGVSRPMAYHLLNREDLPVVAIGRRRFLVRDAFCHWLETQAQNGGELGDK